MVIVLPGFGLFFFSAVLAAIMVLDVDPMHSPTAQAVIGSFLFFYFLVSLTTTTAAAAAKHY